MKVKDTRDRVIRDVLAEACQKQPDDIRIRLQPYVYHRKDAYAFKPLRGLAWTIQCDNPSEAHELIGLLDQFMTAIGAGVPLGTLRERLSTPGPTEGPRLVRRPKGLDSQPETSVESAASTAAQTAEEETHADHPPTPAAPVEQPESHLGKLSRSHYPLPG